MFDVRVHGRASADVTGTAELLARAAVIAGRPARVLVEPGFAAGAGSSGPVVTHCVIDDHEINGHPAGGTRPRPHVDGLIVQDSGLLPLATAFEGICPQTYVVVNSTQGFGDLGLSERLEGHCRDRLMILPAAGLRIVQQDGSLLSAMMAGGFAALAGAVDLASVVAAIRECDEGPAADGCAAAARAAHDFVRTEKEAMVAA
jgi:Pyruvate/2-oxoacid:ferredoxin oxidoreductase gamma subunit